MEDTKIIPLDTSPLDTNRLTDVMLSIYPRHIPNILSGIKDHEFRKYAISSNVTRMRLYESAPISSLRYIAVISPARLPGDFGEHELEGLRNREFNNGHLTEMKLATHAYKILEVWKVTPEWSLAAMKERSWVKAAPQRFQYVKQEMKSAVESAGLERVL